MPAVVDHDHRRRHVALIASSIIARVGIDAVTMRQIAAEAGFSTAIVTHYFASKQDLLLYTYRMAAENAQLRVERVLKDNPCDLLGCIEALLPKDETSAQDWKVFLAFWHTAVHDPVFAAEQAEQARNAKQLLFGVLRARAQTGITEGHISLEAAAQRLLILVVGAALQAVFDPEAWSAAALRTFFAGELDRMGWDTAAIVNSDQKQLETHHERTPRPALD